MSYTLETEHVLFSVLCVRDIDDYFRFPKVYYWLFTKNNHRVNIKNNTLNFNIRLLTCFKIIK